MITPPKKPKYYVYDSPNKGMGKKRYFPTLKEAKKFQKEFFPYPMVVMNIYKVKKE